MYIGMFVTVRFYVINVLLNFTNAVTHFPCMSFHVTLCRLPFTRVCDYRLGQNGEVTVYAMCTKYGEGSFPHAMSVLQVAAPWAFTFRQT